jgi:hypothetical protein
VTVTQRVDVGQTLAHVLKDLAAKVGCGSVGQEKPFAAMNATKNTAPVTQRADAGKSGALSHVLKDLAVPASGGVEQEKASAAMDARRSTAPVTPLAVDQTLANVLEDLAVPKTDGVEQDQAFATMDASQNTANVTTRTDDLISLGAGPGCYGALCVVFQRHLYFSRRLISSYALWDR